jgi:hypothetical protein
MEADRIAASGTRKSNIVRGCSVTPPGGIRLGAFAMPVLGEVLRSPAYKTRDRGTLTVVHFGNAVLH